jgi:glycosyltransferase involved in cell wall biosynthesis
VNGFVFPAGDVAAMADALVAVLADPQPAHDMGLASRNIIEAWNLDSDIASLRSILRNTIGRERRS